MGKKLSELEKKKVRGLDAIMKVFLLLLSGEKKRKSFADEEKVFPHYRWTIFHPRRACAKIVTVLYSPMGLVAKNRCASDGFFSHKLSHVICYKSIGTWPFEVWCNKSLRIIIDSIMTADGVTINQKTDTIDTKVSHSRQNQFWVTMGCCLSFIHSEKLGQLELEKIKL